MANSNPNPDRHSLSLLLTNEEFDALESARVRLGYRTYSRILKEALAIHPELRKVWSPTAPETRPRAQSQATRQKA